MLDDADVTSTMKGLLRGGGMHGSQMRAVPFRATVVESEPIALNPNYAVTSLWQKDERFTIRGPVPSHTWIEVYHEYNDDCANEAHGRAQLRMK